MQIFYYLIKQLKYIREFAMMHITIFLAIMCLAANAIKMSILQPQAVPEQLSGEV